MPVSAKQRKLLIATLILLAIAISRMLLLNRLEMNHDEVWHVWQTSGSFDDAMRWLPYDWPPLYFVILWGWQKLVGMHPIMMRLLSVLIFMLASALTYRLGRRMFHNENAAWGLTLAYATLGYTIFLSTYVRAYVLMLLLLPLALYLVLRYFDRPSPLRAVLVALAMAAMFYTNLTAVVAFAAIGAVMLVFYPRNIWRWWLPGMLALVFALPEILSKVELAGRRNAGLGDVLPPLPQGLIDIVLTHLGHAAPVLLILGVCLISYALWRRQNLKMGLILILWLLVIPVLLYALDSVIGFFTPQYAWWITLGLAMALAWGFGYLPRFVSVILGVLLIVIMFIPMTKGNQPFEELKYGIPTLPFEQTFPVVADAWQDGDVILIDPECDCGDHYVWDYFQEVYFEHPPHHISQPDDSRRIWYVHRPDANDVALESTLEETHLRSKYIGPWQLFFQLYEAPPDPIGIAFENGLRFHGIEVLDQNDAPMVQPLVYREGETVNVRLWWSLDQTTDADYSITLQLLNEHGLIAQSDGAPQTISLYVGSDAPPSGTSQWQTGQYYVEQRTLTLPYPTNRAEYILYLGVYRWWDGVRLTAEGTNADDLLPLLPVAIMAW